MSFKKLNKKFSKVVGSKLWENSLFNLSIMVNYCNMVCFLNFIFFLDGCYYVLNIYHYKSKGWLWRKCYLAFKFSLCNKLLNIFLCRFLFFSNQDDLSFQWVFGLRILTTLFFHSYTLADYRSIYLISIEFKSIDNNLGTPPIIFFFFFNYYNLAIRVVTFSKNFLQTFTIVRYKITIKVRRNHFIFIFIPYVD
jgi:hypothetical protein